MTQEEIKSPIPKHITMEYGSDGLHLVYRWFNAGHIALAIFCFVWDGFLVFWYSVAFREGSPLVMLVFPLLHVAVGVALTYTALAGFYNKTVVTVGMGKLSIHHTPIPWPGNQTLDAADLKQLYSEEHIIRGKNGTRTVYRLNAVTQNDRKIKLISNMESPEEARFLERKVEEQLGIRDTPVEGEMARK